MEHTLPYVDEESFDKRIYLCQTSEQREGQVITKAKVEK